MPVPDAPLRDFALRYTEAWCSGEPTRVAGFFSPAGSLRINDGDAAIGREAIAQAAQGFMTAFPDLRVMMDDLKTTPDGVEYHWTLTGTNAGSGGTGNQVRISGFEQWRFSADGLIAASQGRFDEIEYRRQLQNGI